MSRNRGKYKDPPSVCKSIVEGGFILQITFAALCN